MRCETCKQFAVDFEVDHVEPVGSAPGSEKAPPGTTWDGFVNRLFCPPAGLQVLCRDCHSQKTRDAYQGGTTAFFQQG